jgi:hypothetical protein
VGHGTRTEWDEGHGTRDGKMGGRGFCRAKNGSEWRIANGELLEWLSATMGKAANSEWRTEQ